MKKGLLFLFFCLINASEVSDIGSINTYEINENLLIQNEVDSSVLNGFDLFYRGDFKEASEIFLLLFDENKEPIYAKYAAMSFAGDNDFDRALKMALVYENLSLDKNDIFVNKLKAQSLIQNGKIYEAINLLEKITKMPDFGDNEKIVIETLAKLYLTSNQTKKALDLLEPIYLDFPNEANLVTYLYALEKDLKFTKMLGVLSEYLESKPISPNLLKASLYKFQELNALNLARDIFEKRWIKEQNIENLKLLLSCLSFMRENANEQGIEFFNEILMFDLFVKISKFKEATNQAKKIYELNNNPMFLAYQGIYQLNTRTNIDLDEAREIAKIVDSAINLRNQELSKHKALPNEQDAFLYNFLGYLLIDYEIDVKKGINLAKKALNIEQWSIYYLDTLAWGYFKDNQCLNAKQVFNKIPKNAIEKEDELKTHFMAIQKCK